ncbi:ANL_collapsed_G0029660.mRNA.1.CDS.1 [Saccharomyces cerevisiae]|nr:ANL_collapsed_G0029660.mRNA.1.CDS.1 [Saccharomyces cerevisiae]
MKAKPIQFMNLKMKKNFIREVMRRWLKKKTREEEKRLEAMRREMEAAMEDEISGDDEEGKTVAYLGTGKLER